MLLNSHPTLGNHYSIAIGDKSLVAAAKQGEHSAYVELCRRHSRRALNIVLRITRNVDDAEDIVQESFVKGFMHLSSFDGRSEFSTWFTKIAINNAFMHLRKVRRRKVDSWDALVESGMSGAYEMVEGSPTPEETLLQKEREGIVRRAVSRLPDNLRCVMECNQSNSASVEEIASRLGITVHATKSRLFRARARLRKTWQQF